LPPLMDSIKEMHFPEHVEPHPEYGLWGSPYFQRLAFEEFFYMSLSLLHQRHLWMKSVESDVILPWVKGAKEFILEKSKLLPFKLTGDQEKSLADIASDLNPSGFAIPMHRLIQGDVGSGKTIVAFLAMLACANEGLQSAIMAPTEILADQHFMNFVKLFPESKDNVILLKGSLTQKQKNEARKKVENGEVSVVIGTQALIATKTKFNKLGLIVVDEQHRFGVEQRIEMKKKSDTGTIPHLLVMTATPIPRSLAMSLYGDLDLSIIREKPPGRKPIKTHLLNMGQMEGMKKRIAELVQEGKQVYVVYPLVEESEELELLDVSSAFEEWKTLVGVDKAVLLHGKMKAKEKEAAMAAFKSGDRRLLVSTTVIEVGVDVPEASVMVIVHAERFGLSQLHQLRGRVGRGAEESICVLVGPESMSPATQQRLQTMVDSDDGFYVAEKDLEIRGPGEFLGTRQSGVPAFRVAQIIRDLKILEQARSMAEEIIKQDPGLNSTQYAPLRKGIDLWWSSRFCANQSG